MPTLKMPGQHDAGRQHSRLDQRPALEIGKSDFETGLLLLLIVFTINLPQSC
jgi:hypothetical protein